MYEQYTDEQIVEMLVPKLNKAIVGCDWGSLIRYPESYTDIIKVIATIYRSAYIRGQLGRSFIIGEKKEKANTNRRWVPVNGGNIKEGDSVRYTNEYRNKKYPENYPDKDVVGKVTRVCDDYTCRVQWPKGTTSQDDSWYAAWSNLEVLLCE